MALFGFGKNIKTPSSAETDSSFIKVLGSGCASCKLLEERAKQALEELGMDTSIEHVTDVVSIAQYGVMTTPALVIDDKVIASGKVLSKKEIVTVLQARNA